MKTKLKYLGITLFAFVLPGNCALAAGGLEGNITYKPVPEAQMRHMINMLSLNEGELIRFKLLNSQFSKDLQVLEQTADPHTPAAQNQLQALREAYLEAVSNILTPAQLEMFGRFQQQL